MATSDHTSSHRNRPRRTRVAGFALALAALAPATFVATLSHGEPAQAGPSNYPSYMPQPTIPDQDCVVWWSCEAPDFNQAPRIDATYAIAAFVGPGGMACIGDTVFADFTDPDGEIGSARAYATIVTSTGARRTYALGVHVHPAYPHTATFMGTVSFDDAVTVEVRAQDVLGAWSATTSAPYDTWQPRNDCSAA